MTSQESGSSPPLDDGSTSDRPTALDGATDALIEAHRFSVIDGDPLMRHLIEAALMHIGKRIAEQARKPADHTRVGTIEGI